MDDEFKLDPEDYDFNKGGLLYFHGEISREEASARLTERKTDGVFLVRIGSTGQAVISIFSHGTEKHVQVKKGDHGGVCLGSGPEMPSVTQMMIANFGREIPGVGIKFSIPIPPSTRIRTANMKPSVPEIKVNESEGVSTKNPFQTAKSTNPFGSPPPSQEQVDVVSTKDLTVGELRMLLQMHKIDYSMCNGRADLEMLATGLSWKSKKGRTTSLTGRPKTASTKDQFLETSAPIGRSKSVGRTEPGGNKSLSESALEGQHVAAVPVVEKTTSALNLFAQYKKNAKKPTTPKSGASTPRSGTSPIPVTAAAPVPVVPQVTKVTSVSAPTTPASRITSASSSTETSSPPSREAKQRLSMMANDFFGSLIAESKKPESPADGSDSVIAAAAAATTKSPSAPSAKVQPPPPVPESDDDDLSDDDLSDDDSSDEDEDDVAELGDSGGKISPNSSKVASRTVSSESKASAQFWDKMKEATEDNPVSTTGMGGADAAELRKQKRREKLAAMAKQNF